MRKLVLCGVLLALTACGPKKEAPPAADAAPADTSAMQHDSMMPRDSAHQM